MLSLLWSINQLEKTWSCFLVSSSLSSDDLSTFTLDFSFPSSAATYIVIMTWLSLPAWLISSSLSYSQHSWRLNCNQPHHHHHHHHYYHHHHHHNQKCQIIYHNLFPREIIIARPLEFVLLLCQHPLLGLDLSVLPVEFRVQVLKLFLLQLKLLSGDRQFRSQPLLGGGRTGGIFRGCRGADALVRIDRRLEGWRGRSIEGRMNGRMD